MRGGTSFSGGSAGGSAGSSSAGGSGWDGEGDVVGGTGGAAGEPSGSTSSTGDGEGDGEEVRSVDGEGVEATSLTLAVEEDGEVAGNGAGRHWEKGDNCSLSSESLSRSSSASHLRLAAFRVRLAGGEAIVAGEGTSGGVGSDWDDAVGRGAPWTGGGSELAAAVAGARLRQRRRRRTLAGTQVSEAGAHRRQEIKTS